MMTSGQRWKLFALQGSVAVAVIAIMMFLAYAMSVKNERVRAQINALDSVLRGMDEEDLVKAVGEPDDVSIWDRHGPNEHETWTYRPDIADAPTYMITIKGGEVTKVNRL